MTLDHQSASRESFRETPLTAHARLLTMAAATGIMLVFYAYCAIALAWICLLIAIDLTVALMLLRFGLTAVMMKPADALIKLAGLICRSMNIRRGPDFSMKLQREEAPRLFDLIELVARKVGVSPPTDVVVRWMEARGST